MTPTLKISHNVVNVSILLRKCSSTQINLKMAYA